MVIAVEAWLASIAVRPAVMLPLLTIAPSAMVAQLQIWMPVRAPVMVPLFDTLPKKVVAAMDASFDALAWVRALRSRLAKRAEKAGSAGPAAEAISEALGQARRLETGVAEAGRAGTGLANVNATLGAILTAADAVDAAPTATQSEGYATARSRLDILLAAWRALSTDGLARLNAALRGAGIPEVTPGELERAPRSPEGRAGTEIE